MCKNYTWDSSYTRRGSTEHRGEKARPDFIGVGNFNSVASRAQLAGTKSQRDLDGLRYDAFYSGLLQSESTQTNFSATNKDPW